MSGWLQSFSVTPREKCPEGPHQGPAGPNEDIGQCPKCWMPIGVMRPDNEQFGLHADDCSLPLRHPGHCVGGGEGHAPVEVVRGYWPAMDEQVAAARAKHATTPTPVSSGHTQDTPAAVVVSGEERSRADG